MARRARRGVGLVFMTPIKGAAQIKAAKATGLAKATDLQGICVEGPDKAGLGATITNALADAGINVRGLSAAAIGRRCVCYIALDSTKDANKAVRVLKKAIG